MKFALSVAAGCAFVLVACGGNTDAGNTRLAGTPSSGSAGSGSLASTGSGSGGSGAVSASGSTASAGSVSSAGASGSTAGSSAGSPAVSGSASGPGVASGSSGGVSPEGGASSGAVVVTAPRGPSAGCNKAPGGGDNSGGFTKHDIMVSGVDAAFLSGGANYGSQGGYDFSHRNYFLKLPMGYDPTKAYPLVAGGGGCGATDGLSGNGGGVDIFNGDQSVAIQVGLSYVYPNNAGACFADDFPDTPDLPYFDTMLAEVEANYCIDRGKIFVAGYSSGAWEAIMLGCARGGVVRGIGTQAGGLRIHGPTCNGMPVAPMMIAGVNDTENPIGPLTTPMNDSYGSAPARDEFLKQDGCNGTVTAPYQGMSAESACVSYTGCQATAPVVWCPIAGDHGDLGSTSGFWPFWSSLPSD
jgi:polyhydroxybutyrate depolymerase